MMRRALTQFWTDDLAPNLGHYIVHPLLDIFLGPRDAPPMNLYERIGRIGVGLLAIALGLILTLGLLGIAATVVLAAVGLFHLYNPPLLFPPYPC